MASVEHAFPPESALAGATARGINDLARLRLVVGSILILIALVGLLGTDWDIQWHAVIGRDRTFTPPHDLILLGIGLSGIVALIGILIETRLAQRHPDLRASTTEFGGVVLSTFGVIYLLLSAAHLAQMQQERWTTRLSYASLVVSLGLLLSKLSTFLTPALKGYQLHLAFLTLNFFPFLLALCAVFVFVLTMRLVPWTGAASMVVVVFLLLFLLVSAFVPPMMTLLVQAEHGTYLAKASRIGSTIVPLLGQTPVLLLASLSLDGVVWLGRRSKWTLRKRNSWQLVT